MAAVRGGGTMTDLVAERGRILAEFDRRDRELPKDAYAITRPENMLRSGQALRTICRMLGRAGLLPLGDKRILDVGCGTGGWLIEMVRLGARPRNISGIDLCPNRIAAAAQRLEGCDLRTGCASNLPWPDESFDLALQITVFTSMLHPGLRRALAREMLRVLKPAGAVVWFDLRVSKPWNTQVCAIHAREIRELFAGHELTLVPAVLAPPLARLLARRAWWLAELLHACPLLRTHYIGIVRK